MCPLSDSYGPALRLRGTRLRFVDDYTLVCLRCATTLTQRGYDNVFLLSGGLRVATLRYPESLVSDR